MSNYQINLESSWSMVEEQLSLLEDSDILVMAERDVVEELTEEDFPQLLEQAIRDLNLNRKMEKLTNWEAQYQDFIAFLRSQDAVDSIRLEEEYGEFYESQMDSLCYGQTMANEKIGRDIEVQYIIDTDPVQISNRMKCTMLDYQEVNRLRELKARREFRTWNQVFWIITCKDKSLLRKAQCKFEKQVQVTRRACTKTRDWSTVKWTKAQIEEIRAAFRDALQ